MATWPAVSGVINGEYLEENVLNRPTRQLRERTDWLRQRINELLGEAAFESLRLIDVALSVDAASAPAVGDFVYLNPQTRVFEKALSAADILANLYETAADSSYALGILAASHEGVGTVIVAGRVRFGASGINRDDLLETDAEFRDGPYYLSNTEAGRMTAEAKGPAIYLGYFVDGDDGGYAVLAPQYKDVGEAHIHRAFPLMSQPAGAQGVIGDVPNAVHVLYGAEPLSNLELTDGVHTGTAGDYLVPGTWVNLDNYSGITVRNVTQGTSGIALPHNTTELEVAGVTWANADEFKADRRCRLVLSGNYTGLAATQYVLTLTDDAGDDTRLDRFPENGAIDNKTQGFLLAYLHWRSSDPAEGSGRVRLTSYEVPVAFGTKGMFATLENALENADGEQYWHWCEASADQLTRRQWTVTVPDTACGWQARRFRQTLTATQATDQKHSMILFGGPYVNADSALRHEVHAVTGRMYAYRFGEVPADGETLTLNNMIFEFDDNDSVSGADNVVAVPIASDALECARTLLASILAAGVAGVHVALSSDLDNPALLIAMPTDAAVTLGGNSANELEQLNAGDTTRSLADAAVMLLVFDDDHMSLVEGGGLWEAAQYYTPVSLTNGLRLMFIPYSGSEPATGHDVVFGDFWTAEILDEAPGALFEYTMGMDADLRRFYPPTPITSATMVVNGLEQSAKSLHPDAPAYHVGMKTIYWFTDRYGEVPWPLDWVSPVEPGSGKYAVHSTFYVVHMRQRDTSVVTSLQPAPGAPIRVLRCGTNSPASTGDLMLDIDLQLSTVMAGLQDYQVIKSVSGTQLLKGPVVSKINPGAGISIISKPGQPTGQGEVTISLTGSEGHGGEFEEIALNNAKQEMIGMFPYIRLLGWNSSSASNIPSGFVAKFHVPVTISGQFQVLVYMTVFGEVSVAKPATGASRKFAGLTFNYSVLRDYAPDDDSYGTLLDNLIHPAAAKAIVVPLGDAAGDKYPGENLIYKAYDPMLIHNNPAEPSMPLRAERALGSPFPARGDLKGSVVSVALAEVTVHPGSLVAIAINRAGVSSAVQTAGNEYVNPLGFINMRWRLVAVPQ